MRPAASANRPSVWAALLAALAVNAGGWFLGYWHRWWWYDDVAHVIGTFAATLWLGLWLYGAVLGGADRHAAKLRLAVTLLGLGVGAAWEIAEWGYDQLPGPGNTTPGMMDAMLDLVLDTGGAFAAALVVRARVARG